MHKVTNVFLAPLRDFRMLKCNLVPVFISDLGSHKCMYEFNEVQLYQTLTIILKFYSSNHLVLGKVKHPKDNRGQHTGKVLQVLSSFCFL